MKFLSLGLITIALVLIAAPAPAIADTELEPDPDALAVLESEATPKPSLEATVKLEVEEPPLGFGEEISKADCKKKIMDRIAFLSPKPEEWAALKPGGEREGGSLPVATQVVFSEYAVNTCAVTISGFWCTAPGVLQEPKEIWVIPEDLAYVDCRISQQNCVDLQSELQQDHLNGKTPVVFVGF